ncbi:MAG: hypothetical protein E7649_00990 [Ruminococcaceae bacterium]|nr:hypothetical protein [Oscillospiraceae bacterium]
MKHEIIDAKLEKMTVCSIIEDVLFLCFIIMGAVCAHFYESVKEIICLRPRVVRLVPRVNSASI